MLEKLNKSKKLRRIDAQISRRKLCRICRAYAKTMKQHRSLEELVEKYREVKRMNED
jgi:protein subunit release factor A